MQTKAIPTSAPGDCAPTSEEPAPIKMTNQQLDTPVHDGHCTLSSVIYFRPALHAKNCAPDKGNAAPVHPYPVVPPETRVPKRVSRNPVSHIPV